MFHLLVQILSVRAGISKGKIWNTDKTDWTDKHKFCILRQLKVENTTKNKICAHPSNLCHPRSNLTS